MTGHLDQHGFNIIYDLSIFILKEKDAKTKVPFIIDLIQSVNLEKPDHASHFCSQARWTCGIPATWQTSGGPVVLESLVVWNPWWFEIPQNGVLYYMFYSNHGDPNHVGEFRMDFFLKIPTCERARRSWKQRAWMEMSRNFRFCGEGV